jgi:uncharacterized phage protein (TIGR02218 family)
MKTLSAGLQTHLTSQVQTICTLWQITRQDATVLAFTDHDLPITYDGVVYEAASGYTRSALQSNLTLAVDNLELEGLVESEAIDEAEVRRGLFDLAEIRVMLVNYADLTQGVVRERRGWLGEVRLTRPGLYTAELRGLTQAFSRNIIELATVDCLADLGDSRCTVDLTPYTVTSTVTGASDGNRHSFEDSARTEASGWFMFGLLTWLTGLNAGGRHEVKSYTLYDSPARGGIELFLPTFAPIQAGDTYQVYKGCAKTLAACQGFNNVPNYRGAGLFVPGLDKTLRSPDSHA